MGRKGGSASVGRRKAGSVIGVSAGGGVGASVTKSSKVWRTPADGIPTEVYYPTVETVNVRGTQFVVGGGEIRGGLPGDVALCGEKYDATRCRKGRRT